MLLAHALGCAPAEAIGRDPSDAPGFAALLDRRTAREPMAFILGSQGFWKHDFRVSPATLIPRADSEALVEAALARFDVPPTTILDLGTGTGCLLLSLLAEWPDTFGVGVDLSPDAAALAAENARRLGVADRAALLAGSWADAIAGRFDLVLSNPPYIRSADIPDLMPEVSAFEPATALDGGDDGLCAYRVIVGMLPRLLTARGSAVLELGAGQGAGVAAIAASVGLRTAFLKDLNEIDRVAILTW